MYFGLKPNSPYARPLRYNPIILPLHSGILMAARKTTKKKSKGKSASRAVKAKPSGSRQKSFFVLFDF
jgi:hypothetical protein